MNDFVESSLVSIIVITYNSSRYVIETLNSAFNQTYKNIELIISDDCSTDNTVEICRRWAKEKQERFQRIELVTVEKNTGIAANCNRGVNASNGKWVKLIAGDDYILSEFIEKSIKVFLNQKNVGISFTNTILIDENSNIIKYVNPSKYKSGFIFNDLFFVRFWPTAPSLLYEKCAIIDVGGFDEKICVEDYLLVLKIAEKYKIQHINEYLTCYRRHNLNIGKNSHFLYQGHLDTINKFKSYKGYKKRMKQLHLSLINLYARNNKKEAIKLIFSNNYKLPLSFSWFKVVIKLLLPNNCY
jgi:glycosyltransferase involved in cell wall biosynthesis